MSEIGKTTKCTAKAQDASQTVIFLPAATKRANDLVRAVAISPMATCTSENGRQMPCQVSDDITTTTDNPLKASFWMEREMVRANTSSRMGVWTFIDTSMTYEQEMEYGGRQIERRHGD